MKIGKMCHTMMMEWDFKLNHAADMKRITGFRKVIIMTACVITINFKFTSHVGCVKIWDWMN